MAETGAMDGNPWHNEEFVTAVKTVSPALPHLQPALVTFFAAEYALGGLIDESTTEERELAWMPPTNNVNKVLFQRQPQLTMLQYNAQAMYHHNNTQSFMKENFTKEAQNAEAADMNRTLEIVENNRKKQRETNKENKEKRVAKAKLIFNREEIMTLKSQKLTDHLAAFQAAGTPNLNELNSRSPVGEIRQGLQAAIDLYVEGTWAPKKGGGGPSHSGEEFDTPNKSQESEEGGD
ncbi:hypothetical protein BDQ12DRAFT_698189 [Crucibulum laeve]|uniref:Uncharacterized protein n=1 Tax=Crucibulum laeve TaxID=68775 RepID=A0A5C3M6R5_9AGAR|nr:hypothetical protein BDQ12DRAFT_698189 [Crucibulum laeve]